MCVVKYCISGIILLFLLNGCTKKENSNDGATPQNGTNESTSDITGLESEKKVEDFRLLGVGELNTDDLNNLLQRSDILQRSDLTDVAGLLQSVNGLADETTSGIISRTDLSSAGITSPIPIPIYSLLENGKSKIGKDLKKLTTISDVFVGIRLRSINNNCDHPFVPIYFDASSKAYFYQIAYIKCFEEDGVTLLNDDKVITTIEVVTEAGENAFFRGKKETTSYTTTVLSSGNQVSSIADTPKFIGERRIMGSVFLDSETSTSIFGYSDSKYLALNKFGLVGKEVKDEFTITGDPIESLDIIDLAQPSSEGEFYHKFRKLSVPVASFNLFNKVTISYTPEEAGKKLFAVIVNNSMNIPFNVFVAAGMSDKFNTTTELQSLSQDYKGALTAVTRDYFAISYTKYIDLNIGSVAVIDTYSSDGILQDRWESDIIPPRTDGGYDEAISYLFFDENLYQVGLRDDITYSKKHYYRLFSRNITTNEFTYNTIASSDSPLDDPFSFKFEVYRNKIGLYSLENNKFHLYDSVTLVEIASYSWETCALSEPRAFSMFEDSLGQINIVFTAYEESLDSDTLRLCIANGDKLELKYENYTERSRNFFDIAIFSQAPIIVTGTSADFFDFGTFDGLTGAGEIYQVVKPEIAQNISNNIGGQYIDISNNGYYTAYAYSASATSVKVVIQVGSYVDEQKVVTINTSSQVLSLSMKFIDDDSIIISVVNDEGLTSYIIE